MSGAPRLLAAGESRAVYAHTGYSVIHMNQSFSQYRPLVHHTLEASVLLAMAVLACARRHQQQRGELVRAAVWLLLVAVVAAAIAVSPVRYLLHCLDARCYWPVSGALWALLLAVLVAWVRAQQDPLRRAAVTASALLAAAITAPMERQVNPAMLSDMLVMERLAAATEAQAVRLSRWPTAAEWQAEHGQPMGVDGTRFVYRTPSDQRERWTYDRPNWKAYAIAAVPAHHRAYAREFSSDDWGADGLFAARGAHYPSTGLRPENFGLSAWPHGRAPRDPKVRLPAWPAEPAEKRSGAGDGQ